MGKEDKLFDDDARFTLTPNYILYDILSSMFDVGEWDPTRWEVIYELFMKRLENAGYIAKEKTDD